MENSLEIFDTLELASQFIQVINEFDYDFLLDIKENLNLKVEKYI